jgi:hypothetical protein
MIIGEFQSEYDSYDEATFDYLFKRKPKSVQQQKKADRKDRQRPRKLVRKLQGGRKFPLIGKKKRPVEGNFGIFDKEKVQEAAGPTDLSSAETSPDPVPPQSVSTPVDAVSVPRPVLPSQPETAENSEIKISANKVTEVAKSIVSADDKTSTAIPSSERLANEMVPTTPAMPSEPSNPKEAGFAKFIGFGGLFLVVCLLGYTMFRSHQQSAVVK